MSFLRKSAIPAPIRSSPLAADLPKGELTQLCWLSTMIDITEGEEIIAESTPGRECFIVVDGDFDVTTATGELRGSIGAGEVAGELALLTGRARNASVVAANDAAVCVLHPREFATLLSQAHRFRSTVMTSAYARLNSDSITLPAQFVRRIGTSGPIEAPWSRRLGDTSGR